MDTRHMTSGALWWRHTGMLSQESELRDGDEVVGTLTFRSAFGTMAAGQCADGRWTFKRVGFWTPRVTVRVEGEEADIAVFENSTWTGGGTVTLADGRQLLASTNFWNATWHIHTASEEPLVTFEVSGILRREARVTVQPAALRLPELPWLIMLGWYLIVLRQYDASAAAMIGS